MENITFMALVLLFIFILALADASADSISVKMMPDSINTMQYETFMGHIEISAADAGSYTLRITGTPEAWLEYPSVVNLNGKADVSYTITPSEPGVYDLTFFVSGPSGDSETRTEMWVGMNSGNTAPSPYSHASVKKGLPSSGMFSTTGQGWMLIDIAAVALAVMFAVLLGYATLRRESV